jgi:hypothetical protein
MGPVRYSVKQTSDDPYQQVADTIGIMKQYAVEDAQSPEVQADIARAWQSGDPIGDTFGYIKGRLQFIRDESTAEPIQSSYAYPIVETLCRPRDMAVAPYPQGDCDDFSMYGAAHLLARGVPVSFVTVAADGSNDFSHVYLAAYPKSGPYAGRRVALDISHGAYPGWEYAPNSAARRQEWPCDSSGTVFAAALLIGGGVWLLSKFGRSN